jgi:hypothetical protein
MSSFICEKCKKDIIDTPSGYITGCEHYPLETPLINLTKRKLIRFDLSITNYIEEKERKVNESE